MSCSVVDKHKQSVLVDYQQIETDDTCGMKLWLSRLEGGSGVQAKDSLVSNMLAAEIHADMRCIALMDDLSHPSIQGVIDDVLDCLSLEDKKDQTKMELLYRRLGWLAAYALYIEPSIRMEYFSIPIDSEVVLDREPLWVIVHPDRLLQHKVTKDYVYREYIPMPAGLTNLKWLHGWHFNMRMHAGLAAAMEDR